VTGAIGYGAPAMGGTVRARPIRVLVMLAATLVSLWAGALVLPDAGTPDNRVTPSLVQLGIEPAALRQTDQAPQPPLAVPGPRSARDALVAHLGVALPGSSWQARHRPRQPYPPRGWRLLWSSQLPTRAPPRPCP
jgi:hypothetical protein